MAKKENQELRQSLRMATRKLLCEKGYAATSYQAVADEAGVARTIVQYYYPRKLDMAVEVLDEVIDACAKALSIEGYAHDERLTPQEAYEIGCVYYGFLFSTEGTRALFFDILKDRALADEMLVMQSAWVTEKVHSRSVRSASLSPDQVIALGGFYELMYQTLKRGGSFDIQRYLHSMMSEFVEWDTEQSNARTSDEIALAIEEVARILGDVSENV